ncbi:MAG TPA: hypothetical protein VMU94_10405 [Streptosporangiaceae bacterium]|nr:hypothetical protein [Streptosporangiaceae bacterium]
MSALKTSPADRESNIAASDLDKTLKHERYGEWVRFATNALRREPFLLKAEINGADARTAEGAALAEFRKSEPVTRYKRTMPVRKQDNAARELLQAGKNNLDADQAKLRIAWEYIYRNYWDTLIPSARDLVWLLFALADLDGPSVLLSHRLVVAMIALVTGKDPYDFTVIPKRAREQLLRAGIEIKLGKATAPEHRSTRTTAYNVLSGTMRTAISDQQSTSPSSTVKGLVDKRDAELGSVPDYPLLTNEQIEARDIAIRLLRVDKESRAREARWKALRARVARRHGVPVPAESEPGPRSAKEESRRLVERVRETQAGPESAVPADLESLLDEAQPGFSGLIGDLAGAGRAEYIDKFRELYCQGMEPAVATEHLDYQYRALVDRQALADAVARLTLDVDSQKMKPTAFGKLGLGGKLASDYHDVLNALWSRMLDLGEYEWQGSKLAQPDHRFIT